MIVCLNLPNKYQVVRKACGSFNSPGFLFPPLELMYLAAVAQRHQVRMIDAVAERLTVEETLDNLGNPSLVVFITGFEMFGQDMIIADILKSRLPHTKFIATGYYPTIFPEEILRNSKIDAAIMGEPEATFKEICDGKAWNEIDGLAFRTELAIMINSQRQRIEDLDSLPFPNRQLLNFNLYHEPFLDRPFTSLLTARGCAYRCSYCVKPYGDRLVYRSAENVLAEIKEILYKFGINNIRFMDDTFTFKKERVLKICRGMMDIKVNWTALSRVDTIDSEMLKAMKAAGCKRLYLGIESGSQKTLDYYRKGYRAERIAEAVRLIRKNGIETSAFFMISPRETEENLRQTLKLAKDCKLDFCTFAKAAAYPGTKFYDDLKEEVHFSLLPYRNHLKDARLGRKIDAWQKKLFWNYYFSPAQIVRRIGLFFRHPFEFIYTVFCFLKYLFLTKKDDFI